MAGHVIVILGGKKNICRVGEVAEGVHCCCDKSSACQILGFYLGRKSHFPMKHKRLKYVIQKDNLTVILYGEQCICGSGNMKQ